MTVIERIVDVRDEEPPRPFELVIAALRTLADGEYISMLHRREPMPLYAVLAEMGCAHRTIHDYAIAGESVPVRVLIWRQTDAVTTEYCGPADEVPPAGPKGCL